jgi:hypothetical protein
MLYIQNPVFGLKSDNFNTKTGKSEKIEMRIFHLKMVGIEKL